MLGHNKQQRNRLPLLRLSEASSLNRKDDSTVSPAIYYVDLPNPKAYAAGRAHRLVRESVLRGKLTDLHENEVSCIDCGQRATDWEHRDYSKPLDVVPVCRSCNCLRGAATI